MGRVEVVLANEDRVTLRVGDTFLKVDADHERTDREVEAISLAPVPTPEIRWRRPGVLALAAVRGRPLGRLGGAATSPPAAWVAAGSAVRTLHDAPLPSWPGRSVEELARRLGEECAWLLADTDLHREVVERNRASAESALRQWTPVSVHGDLHLEHVLVDGDEVAGIIDWSEAGPGDALYDLATLTLGHEDRLDDVLDGYGRDVDVDLIRAWWSWRCLVAVRWLTENGYGPPEALPEVALLHSLA